MNLPIYFTCRADALESALKDIQVGCTPKCGFWYMAIHNPLCKKYTELDRKEWDKAESHIAYGLGK